MVDYKFAAIVPLFFVIIKLMPSILCHLIKVTQIKCRKLAAQKYINANGTQNYGALLIRRNYDAIL